MPESLLLLKTTWIPRTPGALPQWYVDLDFSGLASRDDVRTLAEALNRTGTLRVVDGRVLCQYLVGGQVVALEAHQVALRRDTDRGDGSVEVDLPVSTWRDTPRLGGEFIFVEGDYLYVGTASGAAGCSRGLTAMAV